MAESPAVERDYAAVVQRATRNDYLAVDDLRTLQQQRLQRTVQRIIAAAPQYRRAFDSAGVDPQSIRSLDDLERLPLIGKSELQQAYPLELLAVPRDEVLRFHASSGTTGRQVLVGYTRADLDVWTEAMVRVLAWFGVHRRDIVLNAYGYGLFTGGLGFHYGAEELGATVIPASSSSTERLLVLMRDFAASVVCCTPSFFQHIADRAEETGVDLQGLPLRIGIFGAEPWSEEMRQRIESASGIEAFDIYGLAEIIGPGVAAECSAHQGLHVLEDHFLPEIIDPLSGRRLSDGEEGELVLTTLTRQANPMLRYRTGDITALIPGQCSCGRTLRRIRRISHRNDDVFIVRGVNVYPAQIEAALLAVKGTLPHYQIVLSHESGQDRAEVQIEVTAEMFSDRISVLEELQSRLLRELRRAVGVQLEVRLVEPRTIARSQGKARRVIDQR